VRRALAANRDQIRLNEDLARLRDDVPLAHGAVASPLGLPAARRLRLLFEALEFKSLVSRLSTIEERLRRDDA
jgi:hypothetical protein